MTFFPKKNPFERASRTTMPKASVLMDHRQPDKNDATLIVSLFRVISATPRMRSSKCIKEYSKSLFIENVLSIQVLYQLRQGTMDIFV